MNRNFAHLLLLQKGAHRKNSPDLYLLYHAPDVLQKNIRLQLDLLACIPIHFEQLKVFGTAANHQREQNCHFQYLREREREKSSTDVSCFFPMSQMAHTPFELLLMRRLQVLTVGDSSSSSFFLPLPLLLSVVSSSSSSVLSLWSGSGGRQKSCFRVSLKSMLEEIRIAVSPGRGGTL